MKPFKRLGTGSNCVNLSHPSLISVKFPYPENDEKLLIQVRWEILNNEVEYRKLPLGLYLSRSQISHGSLFSVKQSEIWVRD